MKCDAVFVVTPPETHYEICKYFLNKGTDVFCEKPLTLSEKTSADLYAEAEKSGAKLFVDWVFMYNPCVKILKQIVKDRGKPKNIIANRLNYGPVRNDVSARWVDWIDFKRNLNSAQNDSAVGIVNYQKTNLQVNVSWEFGKKDRLYTLEFDDGFVYWDDNDKTVIDGFDQLSVPNDSPLHISITEFIEGTFNANQQKRVTLETIRTLENANKI